MKTIITFAIAIITASFIPSFSETVCTIENSNFSVDTIYEATVGPGTKEIELRLKSTEDPSVTNNIFFTVTDLNNPYVEMRAAKAGNHVRQLEVVPEIAERMSQSGELYFAGVNADFFNMSYPYNICGSCVANGFPTNIGSTSNWQHIIFDENSVPSLAQYINISQYGTVKIPSGATYTFTLNKNRDTNDLILYTPQWQRENAAIGHTGTNIYGVEVRLRPVGDNIIVGNELKLEVIGDPEIYIGNMELPSDGYVLSAHGTSVPALQQLHNGDIITATIPFTAEGKSTKVKELLGGCPVMLKNSIVQPASNAIDHLVNKEPRTAVGYNADKSKLYMAVVDGRNAGGSAGVTQRELATIMRYLGCTDALNFDGGGSSTMYVHGLGIKNIPSSSSLDNRPEGVPRTVVNALFAVAVAPDDDNVASIEIREKKVSLNAGENFTPVVYGYNQYGVLVDADLKGFSISLPSEIGVVNGNTIKAGNGRYTGPLTVEYQGLSYSIPVSINGGGEYVSSVSSIVTDESDQTEYYQLNGISSCSPIRGQITILRRGNNTSKKLNF